MIRPIVPADTPALVALSGSSGLFRPDELDAVQGMLDEYHASNAANGHRILAYEDGGTPWASPTSPRRSSRIGCGSC
jgi:hypothetical protein